MHIVAEILHYNNSESLRQVLNAIKAQTVPVQRILIVDNGSDEENKTVLTNHNSNCEILWLQNNGVGHGHNEGWKYLMQDDTIDFIWVFEHDAIPEPDCLETLLQSVVKDELVAYHPSEVDGLDYDHFRYYLLYSRGLHLLEDKTKMHNYRGGLSFNGLLLPVSIIRQIGFLNELYFFGREDIDYARRIYNNGGYVLRVNKARVHHNQHKQKRRIQIGKQVFLIPNLTPLKEYYSYRNSCYDWLQKGKSKYKIYCYHVFTLILTILFKNQRALRFHYRKQALQDALSSRMGPYGVFNS
jgi:GT2 family glycosyltransferase